jgi:hypothetical protein
MAGVATVSPIVATDSPRHSGISATDTRPDRIGRWEFRVVRGQSTVTPTADFDVGTWRAE